jgi:methylmalonyl-CoA/ethylmalonyl-CoA epimerase
MNGHIKIGVALAAGCLIGWFSNAQIVQGQGKQAETPVLGKMNHLGFAVADVEKTAKAFADVFGVEGVPKSQDFRDIQWGPRFPGKIMHVRRMGMTINGITFELLQPLEGESPWKDFMAKGGDGLHHVGFSVPDVTKAVAYLESKGGVQTQAFGKAAGYVDMAKAGVPITFEVVGGMPAAPSAAKPQ